MQLWHRYKYKNLTLMAISVTIAIFLFDNPIFRESILQLGGWGYLGAFLAGIMFVSTFTVSIGTVILFILSDNHLSPIEIGIFAGFGAVVGDYIIFQTIRKHGLLDEVKNIYQFLGGDKLSNLLKTKYFSWTLPVVGAILIATPLPDEIGVTLLGISHMKPLQFFMLSFLLNSIGIFLILSAAVII